MQNYCGESAAVTSLFLLPRIINSHHHGCCVDYEYTKYLHCSSVLFVECSFVVCVTVLCKKLRPKEVQPVVVVKQGGLPAVKLKVDSAISAIDRAIVAIEEAR